MAERDTQNGKGKQQGTERLPDELYPQNRGFGDFGTHGGPHHTRPSSPDAKGEVPAASESAPGEGD